jgi:hypothetical protein
MLDDVPFDEIDAKTLERLKENGVPESRTIDYKRDDPTAGSREKFLANVTSFANTSGGYLLYGVEADEETSVPTIYPGLSVDAVDKFEQALNSMIRDNVDPRMSPPEYQWVEVADGRKVLIIRIRQSWAAPHAAMKHGRYYVRNSNGKQPMDTHALRNAFLLAGRAEEQFDAFCTRREAALMRRSLPSLRDKLPCEFESGAALAVHAAPLAAMGRPHALDIRSNIKRLAEIRPHRTLSHHDARGRANFEGYLVQANPDGAESTYAYCQVFRSGAVEAVSVGPRLQAPATDDKGPKLLNAVWVERTAVADVAALLRLFGDLGFAGPVFVRLSLLYASGLRFQIGSYGSYSGGGTRQLDRDAITLGTAVSEDQAGDVAQLLRPAFDTLWNAFGFDGSRNYTAEGQWTPPPEQ